MAHARTVIAENKDKFDIFTKHIILEIRANPKQDCTVKIKAIIGSSWTSWIFPRHFFEIHDFL